jgi:hypothetical protein
MDLVLRTLNPDWDLLSDPFLHGQLPGPSSNLCKLPLNKIGDSSQLLLICPCWLTLRIINSLNQPLILL